MKGACVLLHGIRAVGVGGGGGGTGDLLKVKKLS